MELHLKENLKSLRERKRLNQTELSKLLGIKTTAYNNFETGFTKQPSFVVLRQIAKFHNVSLEDLIFKDLENVGDSEKTSEKINPKNIGNDIGNDIGYRGKNYENKEVEGIEEQQYMNEADITVIKDVDKEHLNRILSAFKAIEGLFIEMYHHNTSTRHQITQLSKQIAELTQKIPP